MFALSNIVMKGNSKSWSLSHPNEDSIKDFTLDSCMVKGKGLIPQGLYIYLWFTI